MRLPMKVAKNDPACDRGGRGLVFHQPEGDGLAVAARLGLRRRRSSNCRRCRRPRALPSSSRRSRFRCRHSRRRRPRRAAQLHRQGRQSGIADPAERRYRLDRLARADRSRPAAQDVLSLSTPSDRKAERHGLAVVEGDRRGRRRASAACSAATPPSKSAAVNIKALNANAEIKGNVTITSRPKLAAAWHLEPNLGAQVNLGDTSLSVAGAKRQRAGAGQAADRQDRRRAAQCGRRPDPQRSNAGAERAGAMGQGLPLDSAAGHRRDSVDAGAVARAAADPRHRSAAECRCVSGDADARHRGRDPHHPDPDQARLSVPGQDIDHPADLGRGHRSACRSTCRSPTSTRSWRPNLRGGRFPKTAPARSTSPSKARASRPRATGC